MNRTLAGLALGLALIAGPALAADPVGMWAAKTDNGRVQIYRCGAGLCGKAVDSDHLRANPAQKDQMNKDKALRGRLIKGLVLFEGYAGGPLEWKGGPIYDPKTGDRSSSGVLKMVDDDTLVLKGCLGPLCRSERWTRVR
jgi:uncharacterized protein (DUF2147 family)